jgi:hypothetical protein
LTWHGDRASNNLKAFPGDAYVQLGVGNHWTRRQTPGQQGRGEGPKWKQQALAAGSLPPRSPSQLLAGLWQLRIKSSLLLDVMHCHISRSFLQKKKKINLGHHKMLSLAHEENVTNLVS